MAWKGRGGFIIKTVAQQTSFDGSRMETSQQEGQLCADREPELLRPGAGLSPKQLRDGLAFQAQMGRGSLGKTLDLEKTAFEWQEREEQEQGRKTLVLCHF